MWYVDGAGRIVTNNTMKERDYINVRELSNVLTMQNLLRDIVQPSSVVITEEEYRTIAKLLQQWEDKLFKEIK